MDYRRGSLRLADSNITVDFPKISSRQTQQKRVVTNGSSQRESCLLTFTRFPMASSFFFYDVQRRRLKWANPNSCPLENLLPAFFPREVSSLLQSPLYFRSFEEEKSLKCPTSQSALCSMPIVETLAARCVHFCRILLSSVQSSFDWLLSQHIVRAAVSSS